MSFKDLIWVNKKQVFIWGILFVIAILLMVFIHMRLFQYALDDAYIHLRIVENWANYGYPYFNIEEPIKASSSSGWIILIFIIQGLTRILFGNIQLPILVAIINSISITIGLFLFFMLFVKISNAKPKLIQFFIIIKIDF